MPSMPPAPPIVKPVLGDDAFRAWKRRLAAELFDIEPAPTWDAVPYIPHPLDEAYWSGYGLGRAGEHPAPPEHFGEHERFYFACGRLAGWSASPQGLAYHASMERLAATRAAGPEMSDADWDAMARERAQADFDPSSSIPEPERCGCC